MYLVLMADDDIVNPCTWWETFDTEEDARKYIEENKNDFVYLAKIIE